MIMKCLKYGSVAVIAGVIVGGLVFGRDLASYVRSSAKSVQTAVKDKVPIEFELQRARDMVDQIIPELQANILLIAREEVEIGALNADIAESRQNVADERQRLAIGHVGSRQGFAGQHHVFSKAKGPQADPRPLRY